MAAQDAAQGQPGSPQRAVTVQRFESVLGTGRVKSATGGNPRGHKKTIEPDGRGNQRDEGSGGERAMPARRARARKSSSSSVQEARTHDARATRTRSARPDRRSRSCRNRARNRRRARLRCTAPPTRRLETTPSRRSAPSAILSHSTICWPANLRPCSYASVNWEGRTRRCRRDRPRSGAEPPPKEAGPGIAGSGSDTHALAALRAAARDDLPAIGRCHARTKSVFPLPLLLVRLIGSFHSLFSGKIAAYYSRRTVPGSMFDC